MKKVGVPETPLSSALATSSLTRGAYSRRRSSSSRRSASSSSSCAYVARSPGRQRPLVAQQDVVHLPEAALRRRRLGGLGGQLRVRVDVVEREVAPDVADLVPEGRQQLADRTLGLAAVGALEVAVLDERDQRRVVGAADVVALGIDVLGEVEDVLGGARELARSHPRRQPLDDPQHRPADERRQHHRAERAELGLVEPLAR